MLEQVAAERPRGRWVKATAGGRTNTRASDARPPELDLLIACARRRLEPEHVSTIRQLAGSGLDWDRLLALARAHGMLPLLCRHLEAVCPDEPPAPAMERLRGIYRANARRNLAMTAKLLIVLDDLKAHGIAAAAFKGPLLGRSLLGSVALRPFVDLDLLLHEGDVPRARELLVARGFRSPYRLTPRQEVAFMRSRGEHHLYRPTDGVYLELHWRILPDYFSVPLDMEALWGRLESVTMDGSTLLGLGPEDLLLVLCVHGYSHMWQRLEWVCGVAELLRSRPEMNWDLVLRQARELGVGRILSLGLTLASDLLGAPVPPELLSGARADAVVGRLAGQVRRRMAAGAGESPGIREIVGFEMRGRERLRDRARYLLHLLTTSTVEEWQWLPLPDALFPLYRLVRPLALLRKYLLSRGARR